MTVTRQIPRLGLVAFLALAIFLGLASAASASTQWEAAEGEFVNKMNAERSAQGLGALTIHSTMTGIARDWTPKMIANGGISHRPGEELVEMAPDDWQRLGENVGRSVKTGASETELVERLHKAFMDSPGHRANVLGDYNYVGVGVRVSSDGAMWVTVNFLKAPADATKEVTPQSLEQPKSADLQVEEGVRVSRQVFADAGASGRNAAFAVVGRADVFADALGGSALAADQAPILFTAGPSTGDTNPSLHASTKFEIDRVLGGSGTVYLLGGTSAVSDRVASELSAAGYTVRRLAGESRVETSVRVAEEALRVHGSSSEVVIARADQWADAVAGGAYAAATRTPLVLTNRGSLHPEVAGFLARHNPSTRWALGGEVALSNDVVGAAQATRVSGEERTATAVAIAEQMWKRQSATSGDNFASTPSHGEDAWAYALALAPWSAANDGPQLLVGNDIPASVSNYLARLGYNGDVAGDVFSASSVPAPVLDGLRVMVGQ